MLDTRYWIGTPAQICPQIQPLPLTLPFQGGVRSASTW